ncbi:hypothetical protein CYG48_03210 [Neorhizobium sp. SOG26]|nr:hypothetical protein CYG48_03210 [Neorhizobium sp. SOG26]
MGGKVLVAHIKLRSPAPTGMFFSPATQGILSLQNRPLLSRQENVSTLAIRATRVSAFAYYVYVYVI